MSEAVQKLPVLPTAGLSSLATRIFELTPDLAVVITDTEYRVVFCNAAAERLFDGPASHFLDCTVPGIHQAMGVDNHPFFSAAAKVREGGEHAFEQEVALADGPHFLDSRMAGLFEKRRLVGYVLLSRDRTAQLQAQTRERLLARTMAHSPALIILTDASGRIEYVNRRFTESTGYSDQEAIGRRPGIISSGRTPREVYQTMWATLLRGEEWCGELLNRNRDGSLRWHEVRIMPILGPHNRIEYFVSVHEDITDRKANEEALRLSARVFEDSGEAIMITDADNRIVSVNRAFSDITGYEPEEVIGRNPSLLGSGRHSPAFFAAMWESLQENGRWRGEIWDRRKSGQVYPKWLSISTVRDAQGRLTNYLAIFSDITERKAAEDRIAFLAYHDPLTALPNRMVLRDRFEQAIAFAHRSRTKVGLLCLDLDRFKTINDTLGHNVGDELLKAVVERLQQCVRQTDTISRQGGDEFAIALTDIEQAEMAGDIAGKILDRLAQPFRIHGNELSISASIGISLYPTDGDDFDTLLKKADTAMYDVKESGRNGYRFFTEPMNARVAERLLLQNRLAQAIPAGEFLLHYQPQVDLATGRIQGVEALLRWNSRELGWMLPGRFIPVAEETGLIVPLGEWVLNEACRQAAAWRQAGLPELTLSVNLSAAQFKRSNIVQTVAAVLESSGLPAGCLELELTESILLQDADATVETLLRLKAMGVHLSIDDFGTGYSSLSYLRRLAVDKLKIDQSFVRDLTVNPDDRAIVNAIIQLGHNLQLQVVAEGVENESQLALLGRSGCDQIQGYLFSRPVPGNEIEGLLRRGCLLPDRTGRQ